MVFLTPALLKPTFSAKGQKGPTVIVGGLNSWGRVGKFLKNHILRGVVTNRGGWKSLTKRFEFTQNMNEFERIRAIWRTFQKVSKLFFKFLELRG